MCYIRIDLLEPKEKAQHQVVKGQFHTCPFFIQLGSNKSFEQLEALKLCS